jgi:hypothetical protein
MVEQAPIKIKKGPHDDWPDNPFNPIEITARIPARVRPKTVKFFIAVC